MNRRVSFWPFLTRPQRKFTENFSETNKVNNAPGRSIYDFYLKFIIFFLKNSDLLET